MGFSLFRECRRSYPIQRVTYRGTAGTGHRCTSDMKSSLCRDAF